MSDGSGESPDEKTKRLSVISNPNYELPESEPPGIPYEFQGELEARAKALPAPMPVIGPLITGTWGIIAAGPGVGKSMFVSLLIKAMASKKWGMACHWTIPQRRTVLLIDAEMSVHDLAGRYADYELEDFVGFSSIDLMERRKEDFFSLGDAEHQDNLRHVGQDFDVIIVDNIEYTLEPAEGHSIFAPETWKQVEPLTRWAKARNKLLIFVDHVNKEGGVQGTLSKQRGASFVIKLEPEYVEHADTAFLMKFVKLRYMVENRLFAQDTLWWHQGGNWYSETRKNNRELVIEMMNDGGTKTEIREETGLSISQINKIIRKNKHLIDDEQ